MRLRSAASAVLAPTLAVLAFAGPAAADGPDLTATATTAADDAVMKVIVAMDGDVDATVLDGLLDVGVIRAVEIEAIDAIAVTAPAAVARELHTLPGVVAVVPQRKIELHLDESVAQISADAIATASTTTMLDGSSADVPGVTGAGVGVAVVDSGIFALHPDFGVGPNSRVIHGANFEGSVLATEGGFTGEQWDNYTATTGAIALQDEVGHGTHVAGTIAGDGASAVTRSPMAGVAPAADLISLKIASAGNGVAEDFGFEENALFALDYMIRHKDEFNIRVSNNSWGLLPYEPSALGEDGFATDYDAAELIAEAAIEAGIIFVTSSGNDGRSGPGSIRPGITAAEGAISVGAMCKNSLQFSEPIGGPDAACTNAARADIPTPTSFTSHGNADGTGPQVTVMAPGDAIRAAASNGILDAPVLNRCYTTMPEDPAYICLSGTSMSSPHVAGLAALMVEANPDLTPAQAKSCMETTATDIVDELGQYSADADGNPPLLGEGWDVLTGHGEVHAPRAVACAAALAGTTETPAPAPTEEPTPAPDPEPTQDPVTEPTQDELPATGGGLVIAPMVALALAERLRRSGR